ncbi:MAG: ATP-dependent helicase, partial [Acidimicrobiia bacterium]|nr:ATP-dependent helicase [Acidimicrobiia bacterium]
MTWPGPIELGRGVVVPAGTAAPVPWHGASRLRVDDDVVAEPGTTVDALHRAWATRSPVVVELAVDPAAIRQPVDHAVEPWVAGAEFEPWLDRLHFLVWANNYDVRSGQPVWWWARKAAAHGAVEADQADVILPDGTPAWIDGGPRSALLTTGAAVVHTDTVDAGQLDPIPPPVAPGIELDPEQRSAVGHDAGPARVVAPAGSGKTRVLTERLRHLIADRGYETAGLLAVAYNKEAQREMAARTRQGGARIQTLNAWGYQLVTRILGRRPEVVEERAARAIVEGLVPRPVRRVNTDPFARYLEGLSLIRLGLRPPQQVEDSFGDVPGLAAAFGPYRAELAQRRIIDFDEQIYLAVERLLADGALRRQLQSEHRHLLVDEFQDLTPAHVLLIRLLSCPAYDVYAVGDDDQTIYSHVGADPRFLVDFDRYFPGASHHALAVNYRCPAVVTRAAAKLLVYNEVRVAKDIRPGREVSTAGDGLELRPHPLAAGAATVVKVVEGWLAGGHRPEEMAVLTRVQSLLLGPHLALRSA